MNFFKKFLVLNLFVFSVFTSSVKPMGFIRSLGRKIFNPVDVSLNDETARRVTAYANKFDIIGYVRLFRIVNTGRAGLRAYSSIPGNGRGCFMGTQRFFDIARQINFKENFKLGCAAVAVLYLIYLPVYAFNKSDIHIDVPLFHTLIFAGFSFIGYYLYKYMKRIDFYRNGHQ